ncbi:DMT family transporter [Arthrobacter sp. Br18]|uniref:DMT family transporter n=1 Tax=Arthrobacter sp. Br18 TaxID=1312954 RepID=UPI00047A01E2|nr:DMT family transporter [Arthrobacter sp. Br18]
MTFLAIVLALVGAVFLAFGAQRQGSAVRAHTGGLDLNSAGFLRLLRHPRWILGLILLVTGTALNVVALALAPLTVVQPIGAIALVITTVVNSRDQGIRINRPTVAAIAACVFGSALFVILAVNVTRQNHAVAAGQELVVVLLLAIAVVAFGSLALLGKRRLNASAYILGAGVLFGFVAVLTKIIMTHVLDPNGRILLNVPLYTAVAFLAAVGLGIWFVQSAYATGPPDLVIAGLTVIDPLVGIAVGITILGELQPDVQAIAAVGMASAALVAIVGVIALSRHHPDVMRRQR